MPPSQFLTHRSQGQSNYEWQEAEHGWEGIESLIRSAKCPTSSKEGQSRSHGGDCSCYQQHCHLWIETTENSGHFGQLLSQVHLWVSWGFEHDQQVYYQASQKQPLFLPDVLPKSSSTNAPLMPMSTNVIEKETACLTLTANH